MGLITRRQFLATTAAAGALTAMPTLLTGKGSVFAATEMQQDTQIIRVGTRVIEVNGKSARVFGLTQPDGTPGLMLEAGKRFRVRVENQLDESTLLHWHGLTPPWEQDGVPGLTQLPIPAGGHHEYDFLLDKPGTNWMHSHHGLQEQMLMAAPLIVRDPLEAADDVQEVVVLFHDFTFRDPMEILSALQSEGGHGSSSADLHAGHGNMQHGSTQDQAAMPMAHLHDVEYDAFLANDRTLNDPEVHRVERGGRVRLRLINGATATAFWIDLDRLQGQLIAVDGMPVEPMRASKFEFAMGQRLDILVDLPAGEEGVWPIFAIREGERERTGILLATPAATITKVSNLASQQVPAIGLNLEQALRAVTPLSQRPVDRKHHVTITETAGYGWLLNGKAHGDHQPMWVRQGERVEITITDQTSMAHPMHLHGHHFQVVAINGKRISGAMRDTVLVPARGQVTIAFDAINPGEWVFHCHHLYHMAAGMMTSIKYEA